jgi:hypothetical protein
MDTIDKAATEKATRDAVLTRLAGQMLEGRTPELAKAYVGFWGEVGHVGKDANNPHFKNDYASLEAVINRVKPVMTKYGLAVLQAPGQVRDRNMMLACMLVHTSGQAWSFTMELPLGDKATAQSAGSCITYARRYFLLAISGIAPVDDDGNAASSGGYQTPQTDDSVVDEMKAFKAAKGEDAKAALKRFEAEFKERAGNTGDHSVVDVYVQVRGSLKTKKV